MNKGLVAHLQGVEIWSQSFGLKDNPAVLLIMGAGCQGIFWTKEFCDRIASFGFFVIRFDARDLGSSSYFDYAKNPYTLLDMAKDALLLLDFLQIAKAHIVGTSMGGAVAQLLAVHFPSRVITLSLLTTTLDWRGVVYSMKGKPLENLSPSAPLKEVSKWIYEMAARKKELSCFRKLQRQFMGWKLLNGSGVPFPCMHYLKMLFKTALRQRSYRSLLNHVSAIENSLDLMLDTEGKITVPCLIIQGGQDPIFSKDHGKKLASTICNSKLVYLEEMGHNLNACFYRSIIEEIVCIARSAER